MPSRILRTLLPFLALFLAGATSAQQRYTISGYVKDASSGETLIGANVYIKELMKGTSTNTYGYYSVSVEPGTWTVVASFVGYEDVQRSVTLNSDQKLNLELKPTAIMSEAFEVVGERRQGNTEGTDMGRVELDVQQIRTLPALFGEVDLLRTLQFLPGVQSNGEGNSGFYVRGGGPDQNLILLDEATVYNASHLFGFFSVFNADAVKNIELIKGGIPANYGGRLSSVLDIHMKEGNNRKFHGEGGIGLISSRLTLEGPLVKEKGSFMISGRRTYIDVLTRPFVSEGSQLSGSGYYFYDLNAKANYTLSDKDRLFLSGYFGRDVFDFSGLNPGDPKFRIPWGNATVSARWNHVFGPKLFLNTTATFSDYNFEFRGGQDQFAFSLFSGIKDYGLKMDLNHYASVRHNLKYGLQYIRHAYTTSTVEVASGDVDFNIIPPPKLYAHEFAAYVLDDFDVTDQLRVNFGLRASGFMHVGPFDYLLLDDRNAITGEVNYARGERVKTYAGLEPRVAARYRLDGSSSLKASVMRAYQYVHLASFTSVALPTDVWIPSSSNVKPQESMQYAAGYFRDLVDHTWETSVELYYKSMNNLVEYAEGAQPQGNGNVNFDTQLVFGDGYSYGAEFFVKKRTGHVNGWVGYTWSRTMRTFDDINEGREFPSRWDRRHDLSVVVAYEHSKRWHFAATFVYATGQAVTLPQNRYWVEGRLVSEFTDRNGYRMEPYHRLDMAATLKNKETREVKDLETGEMKEVPRRWRSSWTFGIYNVYNRMNPYFIYFTTEGTLASGNLRPVAKQVSLFSILPSVTWNFNF
ncbi:MAG: TonB-dependent receptor [Flavobacteriales bacterium]|nr:TonB-dependent receptor [Flavobacteriales bacterium]